MTASDQIALAREIFRKAQDSAFERSILTQTPTWIATGVAPACAELRAAGFRGTGPDAENDRLVRDAFTRRWGFSLPCAEAVEALKSLGPLLEVGAGSGYWSALLSAAGGSVIATDAHAAGDIGHGFTAGRHWPVEPLSGPEAVQRWPDRTVFCSWPTRGDPWLEETVELLVPGRRLALIIEPPGGKTANAGLYQRLASEFRLLDTIPIPQFPDHEDQLLVYERREGGLSDGLQQRDAATHDR
jgi:hypothetical protein